MPASHPLFGILMHYRKLCIVDWKLVEERMERGVVKKEKLLPTQIS
jgi:hypothetical protein